MLSTESTTCTVSVSYTYVPCFSLSTVPVHLRTRFPCLRHSPLTSKHSSKIRGLVKYCILLAQIHRWVPWKPLSVCIFQQRSAASAWFSAQGGRVLGHGIGLLERNVCACAPVCCLHLSSHETERQRETEREREAEHLYPTCSEGK